MTARFLVPAVAAIAVGAFVGGRYTAPRPVVRPATALSSDASSGARPRLAGPARPVGTALDADMRADIRRIIREEAAAALRESDETTAPAGVPKAAPDDPSPDAEQVRAHAAAVALVESARAEKRWDRARASDLHGLLATMTATQQSDVVQRLIPALNSGEIAFDARSGAPF